MKPKPAITTVLPSPAPGGELRLLADLQPLMATAIDYLRSGKVTDLYDVCRRIKAIAENLTTLGATSDELKRTAGEPPQRRELLGKLTQQCSLCTALLRRCRRSLLLRRQLLELQGESLPYTNSLTFIP